MPAAMTIVTFADADGDEFPISLAGNNWPVDEAKVVARRQLDALCASGDWRPTMPVRIESVQRP